jgi:hypothetical protein
MPLFGTLTKADIIDAVAERNGYNDKFLGHRNHIRLIRRFFPRSALDSCNF